MTDGPRSAIRIESRALAVAGIAGGAVLLAAFALLLLSGSTTVPLSGRGVTLGLLSAGLGALASLAGYIAGRRIAAAPLPTPPGRAPAVRRAIAHVALAFTHIAIVAFGAFGVFAVLQDAFVGLALDVGISAVLVGAVGALVAYGTVLSATALTGPSLAGLLAVFVAAGALTAMLSTDDPQWWQSNFSALGAGDAFSATVFNLTLVVAGLVIAVLADYLTTDLSAWAKRAPTVDERAWRVGVVRTVLIVLGLMVAGVGFVPVDVVMWLHNTFASGLGLVFVVFVVAIPWLLPGIPRSFTLFGWLLAAALVAVVALFAVGYFNFTAFELLAAGIVFVWLIVFVRTSAASAEAVHAAR